jgi:hypothetical protein
LRAGRSSAPAACSAPSCSRTCGVTGCGTTITVVRKPSARPKSAVASPWCVPMAPVVTSRCAPRSRAAANTYSSLRALFPPYTALVRSSRFTKSAPSGAPASASDATGVGRRVSATRGIAASAG